MFELWKAKRELRRVQQKYAKLHEELVKENAGRDKFQELDADEHYAVENAESSIDYLVGMKLLHEARSLDVETPPISEAEMWVQEDDGNHAWFSSKGRAYVRRLIDEEKERRFNVKTLRVTKLIIPIASLILTALVGIIGAITGLVAVYQHKK